MNPRTMKILGIACFVACAISVAVAFERYNANANNVEAMNRMGGSLGAGLPGMNMTRFEPAMPTASKYAIGAAVITGLAGVVCLASGGGRKARSAAR